MRKNKDVLIAELATKEAENETLMESKEILHNMIKEISEENVELKTDNSMLINKLGEAHLRIARLEGGGE